MYRISAIQIIGKAIACQNESGSYNPDMENYIYSPVINIPTGDQVGIDFLVRGSLLDADVFPEVDYWGMQVSPDDGTSWFYVSNPYGDTSSTAFNYVYSDAPEFWSQFSTTYSEPIDIIIMLEVQYRFVIGFTQIAMLRKERVYF